MKGRFNFLQIVGLLMILASCVLLLGSELLADRNRENLRDLTEAVSAGLPQRTQGDPENYSDPAMPVLQVQGKDFSGLLEVPKFGTALPIGSSWDPGTVLRYPCRFWGSAYDNSLIIGGGSGQFDFCGRLDLGDRITVTDMTGGVFSYVVSRIDRRSHGDMSAFRETDSDMVLFTKEDASGKYVIVRCDFSLQGG